MIGSSKSEEPPAPHFFPNTTIPDYFPEELRNKETRQSLLRANWKDSWANQSAWTPIFRQRFFATIPANSELTRLVLALPQNVLLAMFRDGTYRTVATKYRKLQKSEQEIESARHQARKAMRKSEVRP
jgi:hypothetical protein